LPAIPVTAVGALGGKVGAAKVIHCKRKEFEFCVVIIPAGEIAMPDGARMLVLSPVMR
jgi:hypothetical protein